MSFIMNSEGNKEFKEKSSGDDQRAEAFRIVWAALRRRIADQTPVLITGGPPTLLRMLLRKQENSGAPQTQSDFY